MKIDWLELWRELIIANPHTPDSEQIKRYRDHALQHRQRPDLLLDFILQSVDRGMSVLDIGAGDGRWTIPLARTAKNVTAVDPSGNMLNILRENIKVSNLNINIIQSTWEEASVRVHDVVVCAHAMYSSPDFALFVHKMEQHAGKACYMAIRLPPVNGIIGELSNSIFDNPYDSANAVIAYNALYSLGIYTNIMVENDIYHWSNNTIEEAFIRAKRHLHLESTDTYDRLIRDTLEKRLVLSNNKYIWPDGMRSALLWWSNSSNL